MATKTIVATHLSSLFPAARASSIPVQTTRRNLPLAPAPKDADPPPEHASYSTVFHTQPTGTLLLRVLHAGLVIELVPLASDAPPLRFVFPARVLPAPAIVLWEQELHILAVTASGSLYRIVFPMGADGQLGAEQLHKNWCREYHLRYTPGTDTFEGLVQVQGAHTVAVGLQNGTLLRLEAEVLGDEYNTDQWTETLLQHNSFLNQLTSFLHSNANTAGSSEIIALASHPQPTDIGHIWSLSRDRTLRLWSAKLGCVSAVTLSHSSTRAVTPAPSGPSRSSPAPRTQTLLDAVPQNLVRIFSANDDPRVLTFIPTPSSTTSGGLFHLVSTKNDVLTIIQAFECSEDSVHSQLQDFVVVNNTIHALWDRQGQSTIETLAMEIGAVWQNASYPREPELTPPSLDELLLAPGSLAHKFFEAIMRPGMFSPYTLRTAIEQYTDACLTLPFAGPPPLQLRMAYSTLGENIAAVVGCTVRLTQDPHTGAVQHDQYWNALKRDWEGFVARCREIERSARWPLALGFSADAAGAGQLLVVERERLGAVVAEDQPLYLRRCLNLAMPIGHHPHHILFEILWTLRTKLGRRSMLDIEARIVDMLHQEIAFPFADIVFDLAQQVGFREDLLDEGTETWITGRLQSIGGITEVQEAVKATLDAIAEGTFAVKREEEEVEMLLPSSNSEWMRALAAQYVGATVQSRYELVAALVLLLFLLAGDLEAWDPALLAEVFGVYRGVTMLKQVVEQPEGEGSGARRSDDSSAADEVVARLSRMGVGRSARANPTYSIIHQLLAQSGDTTDAPVAAHNFLEATSLLDAGSPAHATRSDVLFCERLRLIGQRQVARRLLSCLPRTPGVSYVLARLWLDGGRADDAAILFQSLAGVFGPKNTLTVEDGLALAAVLPGAKLFDTSFSFYLSTAALFKTAMEVEHEVLFSHLALSIAPMDEDTMALWFTVIRGFTDLGLYEDAYSALVASPFEKLKRECVSQLVYRMCEDSAVDRLMAFSFIGIADEVEAALSFKARNSDPRLRPFYSRILYSWYVSRGDYRNAALAMYQRARKLSQIPAGPTDATTLAELQLEALVVAINALTLLDQRDAWVTLPSTGDIGRDARKRRMLTKYIPDDKFSPGKRDVEIITLSDMEFDYALATARLALARKDPSLPPTGAILDGPAIVLSLSHANQFDTAIATAQSLKVDMTDLFSHLTRQCLRLTREPEMLTQEDASDWLLTDKATSWPGTTPDRGWRYLRLALERHDGRGTDYSYTKAVLETILGSDRASSPPPWLVKVLQEHDPEHLIRACLRYENFDSALEYSLALLHQSDVLLSRQPPKGAMATWLPYNLIDQVLAAADAQDNLSSRARTMHRTLKNDITARLARLQKLSHFPARQSL